MIKKIADKNNLLYYASMLKKKGFKPGIDGMTAEGAELWINLNGDRLCREILNGTYEPMPAKGFRIAKKNGSYRKITKLTALDTIIQNAALTVLEEIAEKQFSDRSFAYRKGFGATAALELYRQYASVYRYAAKIDPCACFDSLNHDILREALILLTDDKELSEFIMKCVCVPVEDDEEIINPVAGVLQGAPLSPLLSNIYLHAMDVYLEEKNIDFIRYADDIVIFSNNFDKIRSESVAAESYMNNKLKLTINKKKFKIDSPLNITYLGYKFISDKKGIIALEANRPYQTSFRLWHESELHNNSGTVDILSDGILRQRDYSAIFETDEEKTNIPIEAVDVINIYSDVVFDSNFIKTALKNKTEINIFDKSGNYLGVFTPNTSLKSPKTTFEQLNTYYDKQKRLSFAKEFVLGSIHNLRLNIRYYNKQNPCDIYEKSIKQLYSAETKIIAETEYENLLLLEARAREAYYECFDSFVKPEEFVFEKRSKRPPENEINAMISFGNTVLYNIIAMEINKSSLDIRIGFLHATNNRKASLNLDIAELFKPLVVDRTVFSLINHGSIKIEHFRRNDNGEVLLNEDGKKIFLKSLYDKLNTVITVKDEKMNYRQIIKQEVRRLTKAMRENCQYTAFRQVR